MTGNYLIVHYSNKNLKTVQFEEYDFQDGLQNGKGIDFDKEFNNINNIIYFNEFVNFAKSESKSDNKIVGFVHIDCSDIYLINAEKDITNLQYEQIFDLYDSFKYGDIFNVFEIIRNLF